jgi:hypothetical protein
LRLAVLIDSEHRWLTQTAAVLRFGQDLLSSGRNEAPQAGSKHSGAVRLNHQG